MEICENIQNQLNDISGWVFKTDGWQSSYYKKLRYNTDGILRKLFPIKAIVYSDDDLYINRCNFNNVKHVSYDEIKLHYLNKDREKILDVVCK